jgi:hypothetical protein
MEAGIDGGGAAPGKRKTKVQPEAGLMEIRKSPRKGGHTTDRTYDKNP